MSYLPHFKDLNKNDHINDDNDDFFVGPLKQAANILLFVQMCGAVFTHYMLKEGMEKMTPALVFGLLLGCRYVVHLQVRAREEHQVQEADMKEKKAQ